MTGVSDERWEPQSAAELQRRRDVRTVRELAAQFQKPHRLRLLALDLTAWTVVAALVCGYLYWASGQIR